MIQSWRLKYYKINMRECYILISIFITVTVCTHQRTCYHINKDMFTTFPRCNFGLEFLEFLLQKLIWFHQQSMPGKSKMMHPGILMNMPYRLSSEFGADSLLLYTTHCVHWPTTRHNMVGRLHNMLARCYFVGSTVVEPNI